LETINDFKWQKQASLSSSAPLTGWGLHWFVWMLPLSNHLFSHWSIPLKTKKERNEDESSEGVIMKEKVEEEVERELTNQSWKFVKGRFNKLKIIFLSGFSKSGEISSTFLQKAFIAHKTLQVKVLKNTSKENT
jgi:hypothetical protein